ncbi:hypothetical protein TURU_113047 [Turdus rufiventris]|nr:hypothetical protein TURU_113047 [Turdus rufiventris]
MSHFRDWLKDGNDKTFKCSVQDLEPGSHKQSALSSSRLPIASQAALKTMSEYKAMYSDAQVGRMLWLDDIQRNMEKFDKWAHGNLTQFYKTKCQVLHLAQGNPQYWHRLRMNRSEQPCEKDLGVLVGERLDMT